MKLAALLCLLTLTACAPAAKDPPGTVELIGTPDSLAYIYPDEYRSGDLPPIRLPEGTYKVLATFGTTGMSVDAMTNCRGNLTLKKYGGTDTLRSAMVGWSGSSPTWIIEQTGVYILGLDPAGGSPCAYSVAVQKQN